MGLPGKRLSRSSKRRRASHFSLKKFVLVACKQCKKQIMAHRTCPFCGTYKQKEVVEIKLPKSAKAVMAPAKEEGEEKKS